MITRKKHVEKKLNREDVQNIRLSCLQSWTNLEQIENTLKDHKPEDIDVNAIKTKITFTKSNIKDIYTILFTTDDNKIDRQ